MKLSLVLLLELMSSRYGFAVTAFIGISTLEFEEDTIITQKKQPYFVIVMQKKQGLFCFFMQVFLGAGCSSPSPIVNKG